LAATAESIAADMAKIRSDLESHDWRTRLSAVEELGKLRDKESIELLMDVALNDRWRVRIRAIRFLGEIGDPDTADLLLRIFTNPFLNSECPAIKWHTALALGNFKNNRKVVDALVEALNYDNLVVREAAIESLGEIGDSKAVPFLLSALKDKSFAIRFSSVRALGKIGDQRAIPYLKEILESDEDPHIRDVASSALQNFNK